MAARFGMGSSRSGVRGAGVRRRAVGLGAAALGGALALTAAAVTPAAAHPAGHQGDGHGKAVHYVALGDSYTSGPAIPTQVDANCARSNENYPSLVAAAGRYASFTDVSCGGATTVQMWQAQGTNGPQLDAVTRDTTLVTVQIGGNDIGFGSIIATCAGLSVTAPAGSPCKDHYRAGGFDQLTLNVVKTAPKIAAVLRAVHRQAPHARVVVVGYPDLLPDDGVGCFPAVPFAAGDFPYLRDTEKQLNAMLRIEALFGGAEYVDTYRPTVGHDMCKAPADRWIEPLVPASPAAPAHPNATGERVMAQAVAAQVADADRSRR
ncbi:SGNH/GDSL hydrolase family protein [Actinacidiphila paucisporea]|uniref:GDSL-like Lipase/Acylhydrolase family protein n=1 Tax=Actinacidiphila paucisporea TaxID=310782 RepID=A0A1M7K267_9ACTN|nr:SGNH/GDSL hydrolase family protein [Actinacidiphila paucisporea]SHM58897.1 GDSL-like Lipase/Acylhydrolase family protein [Actinacidiphila paucisporea]